MTSSLGYTNVLLYLFAVRLTSRSSVNCAQPDACVGPNGTWVIIEQQRAQAKVKLKGYPVAQHFDTNVRRCDKVQRLSGRAMDGYR